jgi:hypothetical protein
MRHPAAALLACLLLPAGLGAQAPGTAPPPVALPVVSQAVDKERALASSVPGYQRRVMEGFPLLIHVDVLHHNDDPEWKRKPLDVLARELATIVRVLPQRDVDSLRRLTVWVEWDDRSDPAYGRAVAKYYGVAGDAKVWALDRGKPAGKANNIEVVSMKSLTAEHQPGVVTERCVLLHEMAHAVHFRVFGADNAAIKHAYQQAMDRKLYEKAATAGGGTVRPYAATNEFEYFAELSCAFLDKLHYQPFTREDLKAHDPVGYQLMEKVWGPARRLDDRRKADAEKVAAAKLEAARRLEADGKKSEARVALARLVEDFPKTQAASDARRLLARPE